MSYCANAFTFSAFAGLWLKSDGKREVQLIALSACSLLAFLFCLFDFIYPKECLHPSLLPCI